MKDLIIVGASGFGREVAWLVERINATTQDAWHIVGFIDDAIPKGSEVGGYTVLGGCEELAVYSSVSVICAVGNAKIRRKIIDKIKGIVPDVSYATLIDPSAVVGNRNQIGEGSVICAHSIITVDVTIGRHVIVNLDCTIGHDASIQDFVTVYPSVNISGGTCIEENVELGTGTQVIPGKKVGQNAIVGAGSVIVKDVPANCTAVGCPAMPIKFFD